MLDHSAKETWLAPRGPSARRAVLYTYSIGSAASSHARLSLFNGRPRRAVHSARAAYRDGCSYFTSIETRARTDPGCVGALSYTA